jgi:hypothetical protein
MATASESTWVSFDELNRLLGMGIGATFGIGAAFLAFVELGADELAEFAFDDAIMFVGVIDDSFAELTFLFEGR